MVESLRRVLWILRRRLPVRGPIRRGQDRLVKPGLARPLRVPGRETAQARCHASIRGVRPRVRHWLLLLVALSGSRRAELPLLLLLLRWRLLSLHRVGND